MGVSVKVIKDPSTDTYSPQNLDQISQSLCLPPSFRLRNGDSSQLRGLHDHMKVTDLSSTAWPAFFTPSFKDAVPLHWREEKMPVCHHRDFILVSFSSVLLPLFYTAFECTHHTHARTHARARICAHTWHWLPPYGRPNLLTCTISGGNHHPVEDSLLTSSFDLGSQQPPATLYPPWWCLQGQREGTKPDVTLQTLSSLALIKFLCFTWKDIFGCLRHTMFWLQYKSLIQLYRVAKFYFSNREVRKWVPFSRGRKAGT